MKRAILFFPELPAVVSEFRGTYDPLGRKVPPHITLIFPFESGISEADLKHHVEECMKTVAPISYSLGSAEIGSGDYIWLPVIRGREEIIHLHEILYTGSLLRHRSALHEYVPHVTVARTSSGFIPTVYAEACKLPVNLHGILDKVVVESVTPDGTSEVLWTVTLKGN